MLFLDVHVKDLENIKLQNIEFLCYNKNIQHSYEN